MNQSVGEEKSVLALPNGKAPYATLDQIRRAISLRREIEFLRRGEYVVAEPYVLGNAVRTGSFVLYCHVLGDEGGWKLLRYCEVRDLGVSSREFCVRDDYDGYPKEIQVLDTYIPTRRMARA